MIERRFVVDALCTFQGQKKSEDVLRVLQSLGLKSFSDARRILATENPRPHTAEFLRTNMAKMTLCFAEIDEMNAMSHNVTPISTPPQTQRQEPE
jgi:hypothetical protein